MNVAFFIPSLSNKGGVERATVSLLNVLASTFQSEVKVFLFVFSDDTFAFDVNDSVKVISLNIVNYKRQYWQLIKRIRFSIKFNKIDFFISVESMSFLFTFIPLFTIRSRPKVVVWEHFNFKNNNDRKIRDWLRRLSAKRSDMIVTLTERDAITWKKHLNPKSKVTHIYNINPFEDCDTSYDVNSKTAIAVGRYVDVKGFDRLIEAWALFEDKYGANNWNLQIVGYGEKKKELQSLIDKRQSKSIILIDGSKNVETIYNNAGLYCMASYFEGLPMTLIEAQSFALPSLAFDIYTGPSEILGCGSGILVEDNNIESYADALFELTSNNKLRQDMSDIAIKNSYQFKGSHIAKKWINELKNILS